MFVMITEEVNTYVYLNREENFVEMKGEELLFI